VKYTITHIILWWRNQSPVFKAIVILLGEPFLVFTLPVHKKKRDRAFDNWDEYFSLVTIGCDEYGLNVFAEGFEWKSIDIFMKKLRKCDIVMFRLICSLVIDESIEIYLILKGAS
jgi:hypothetical protein